MLSLDDAAKSLGKIIQKSKSKTRQEYAERLGQITSYLIFLVIIRMNLFPLCEIFICLLEIINTVARRNYQTLGGISTRTCSAVRRLHAASARTCCCSLSNALRREDITRVYHREDRPENALGICLECSAIGFIGTFITITMTTPF